MGKSYTQMSPEERTAAIGAELKGVFTDATDVVIGGTGLIIGTGLKILGGGLKVGRNVLHTAANINPIKSRSTKIKGFLSSLVAEPAENRVYTEEEIAQAEAMIKKMKADAKAAKESK